MHRASIIAQVNTNTISPTKNIATSSTPFSLVSEAILDQGDSLKTINNAGLIQAFNTSLFPETGAVTSTVTRAIDLKQGNKEFALFFYTPSGAYVDAPWEAHLGNAHTYVSLGEVEGELMGTGLTAEAAVSALLEKLGD